MQATPNTETSAQAYGGFAYGTGLVDVQHRRHTYLSKARDNAELGYFDSYSSCDKLCHALENGTSLLGDQSLAITPERSLMPSERKQPVGHVGLPILRSAERRDPLQKSSRILVYRQTKSPSVDI